MELPLRATESLPVDLGGRTVKQVLESPLIDSTRNGPSAFVLAGIGNTKAYVQCEWVLDKFSQKFPRIPVRKTLLGKSEWVDFRYKLCGPPGWPREGDVIVYREVLQKPLLYIGGLVPLRLYLNQLYSFHCALIPSAKVDDYIKDNEAELAKNEQHRSAATEENETWKVCIMCTNHLEIVPLQLLHSFGTIPIFGGPHKKIELTIYNTTATWSKYNYSWREEPIHDYYETNKWRFPLLKSVTFETDLVASVSKKDVIIILWAMREAVYDAIEGRTYSLREGMNEELREIICSEVMTELLPVVSALERVEDLKSTKVLLTSTRFKTPLSAIATYLLWKIRKLPEQNLLVDSCIVERNYRSVIAEELGVRTADVLNTPIWGNLGGTMLMDPTSARVSGFQGAIEAPKALSYFRPLLEVYTIAQKLQIDFAVDAPRRANYMEMLEGSRCCSLLVAEHAVELLQRWYGTYAWKHEKEEGDAVSVGVFSASKKNTEDDTQDTADIPGFVIVTPVFFKPDGSFQAVNQDFREEIAAILKKATSEITEFLECLKRHFDPMLGVFYVPEVPELPDPYKVDSNLFITSDRLTERFEEYNLDEEEEESEEDTEEKPAEEDPEQEQENPDAEVEQVDNDGHSNDTV